ncbi:MAG: Ig-like domain-containing protein [Chloroflexi bacterium]|nr:Ig-like domain-containing protein [Chloroflexota bacterium]
MIKKILNKISIRRFTNAFIGVIFLFSTFFSPAYSVSAAPAIADSFLDMMVWGADVWYLNDGGLRGDYINNHNKHLMFIGGDVGIPGLTAKAGDAELSAVALKGTVFIDMDDVYSAMNPGNKITDEGADGWVTVWVDGGYSLFSASYGPGSVGFDRLNMRYPDTEQDPSRAGYELEFMSACGIVKLNAWTKTVAGYETGDLDLADNNCIQLGAEMYSLTWNLVRFEVQYTVLESALNQPFNSFTGRTLTSTLQFINKANEAFNYFIAHSSRDNDPSNDSWEMGPNPLIPIRTFTSRDDGVSTGVNAAFDYVIGGNDVDGDHVPDNRFEANASVITNVRFHTTGTETATYRVRLISSLPSGWEIYPLDDDWDLFDTTFELVNVSGSSSSVTTFARTIWIANHVSGSAAKADIEFVVEQKQCAIGCWEELDRIPQTLYHTDQVGNQLPPIISYTQPSPTPEIKPGTAYPISVTAWDPNGDSITDVTLGYEIGAEIFTQHLTYQSGNTWSGEIPGAHTQLASDPDYVVGIPYWFEASDSYFVERQPDGNSSYWVNVSPSAKISGYVKYQNAAGIPGVWVSIGTQGASTDNTGRFDIKGVASGNYVVTPSINFCSFSPPFQNTTVVNSNILLPVDFICNQIQSGLSLVTDLVDVPFDGSSVAHLTATLRDVNNNPIQGVPITFSTNYTGGINSPVTTGPDGKAISTFTPSEVGPVQITARTPSGLSSNTVNLNVIPSSNSIDTVLEIRVKSQTATTTTYHIDGKSTFTSNGITVDNTDILYAVLDQSGNPLIPQIYSFYYGTVTNPGYDRTDNYGNSDIEFTISAPASATIRATIQGSSDSIFVNLQAGAVIPTVIQPFTTMSFPVVIDSDLSMAPSGDWLVASNDDSRLAQAFNARTYQFSSTFTHPDYFGRPYAVDYSSNGDSYVAIGTTDSTDGYSAMVYEGISPFTYYRGRSKAASGYTGDIIGISLSPSNDRIVTIKDTAPPTLQAEIWTLASGTAPAYTFGSWSESSYLRAVDWSRNFGSYSQGVIAIAQIHALYFYNGNGYSRIGSPVTGFDSIRELQWSRDGSKLAVVDDITTTTNNIKLYDQVGNYIKTLTLNYGYIHGIDWDHTGSRFAVAIGTGSGVGKLVIVTISDNSQQVYDMGGRIFDVQWSGDDSELFVAREANNIAVYSLLDNLGPSISAQTNAVNGQTTQDSIMVSGNITDPHFVVNPTIRVNANPPISLSLNLSGGFSQVVNLDEGTNEVLISAQDGSGFSNSLTLNVNRLIDMIPPGITAVSVTPASGNFAQLFTISANISDDWSGVNPNSVYAYVQKPNEANLATVQMFDNGANGDLTAGDGLFTARWQATQLNAEGIYYVDITATDNRNNPREAENGGTFELSDLPEISNITLSPTTPASNAPVIVSVTAVDRSGIADVNLLYAIGEIPGPWNQVEMHISNGITWVGQIPKIASDTLVTYKIIALDAFGHSNETNALNYRVIDRTAPTVATIARAGTNPTSAASVEFTLNFSESVTGIDSIAPFNDLNLITTSVSGASISGVSGTGSVYTITVNTGSGNGTIRLNVVDGNSIVDGVGNPLGGAIVGDGDFTTGETYTVIKVATFTDVPLAYWANGFIERLYNASITGGCSAIPLNYCPANSVTRAQMAVFLVRAMHGVSFVPPTAAGVFSDVPVGSFGADFIEQLAADSITSGCGGGKYCPNSAVTRAQMAIFLVRAKHGVAFTPPAATGIFTDVPVGSFGADYIEQLVTDGITSGCGSGIFCPTTSVKRDSMAVFLVRTFNLP